MSGKKDERLDRHSGTGNRGLPKKDGAGGKFTLGKAGDEAGAPEKLDPRDPMYEDPKDQ